MPSKLSIVRASLAGVSAPEGRVTDLSLKAAIFWARGNDVSLVTAEIRTTHQAIRALSKASRGCTTVFHPASRRAKRNRLVDFMSVRETPCVKTKRASLKSRSALFSDALQNHFLSNQPFHSARRHPSQSNGLRL